MIAPVALLGSRTCNPKRLAGITVMVLFAAVVVSLRKPTVHSKSYNSWKQQYEQATKDLQQRIAALEQQIEAARRRKIDGDQGRRKQVSRRPTSR